MVNRGYYGEDKIQSRRYSNRGHHYALNHPERALPSESLMHQFVTNRSHNAASCDAPNNEEAVEQEGNPNPRKRIPVACGRCRKRKIRCSGNPGNGQPCTNCKSAGTEQCQFLRVSSTEAPFRSETADFGYEALPRLPSRGLSLGSQQYSQQSPLGQDSFPYRNNSLSTYQYPTKGYYGMQPYSEFADENVNVDYLSGPAVIQTYPLLSPEQLDVVPSYGSLGGARNWTNTSQLCKQNQLLEQASSYNPGHLSYASNIGSLRVNVSPETKEASLNGIISYPAPSMSNGRVLPLPGSRQACSTLRSGGNINHSEQSAYPPPYNSTNADYFKGVIHSNTVSNVVPVSATYPPSLSNSSPESTPSQNRYNSQVHPGQQPLYTPISSEGFSTLHDGPPSPGTYSHRRSSEQGLQSSQDHTDAPQHNGSLSNGRGYTPLIISSYPIPPMDPGMHAVPPRRLSSMPTAAS